MLFVIINDYLRYVINRCINNSCTMRTNTKYKWEFVERGL